MSNYLMREADAFRSTSLYDHNNTQTEGCAADQKNPRAVWGSTGQDRMTVRSVSYSTSSLESCLLEL